MWYNEQFVPSDVYSHASLNPGDIREVVQKREYAEVPWAVQNISERSGLQHQGRSCCPLKGSEGFSLWWKLGPSDLPRPRALEYRVWKSFEGSEYGGLRSFVGWIGLLGGFVVCLFCLLGFSFSFFFLFLILTVTKLKQTHASSGFLGQQWVDVACQAMSLFFQTVGNGSLLTS